MSHRRQGSCISVDSVGRFAESIETGTSGARTLIMTMRMSGLALVILGACLSGSNPVPEARADEPPAGAASGFAVVELFTSEGCSSCPPADAVLAELARSSDRPVYVLAFHVDYWDQLGWRDRFAFAENTTRQLAYARAFRKRGVYTPQMIVDGTEQFTGSDSDRAHAAVARDLVRPASVRLSVQVRTTGSATIAVDYIASRAPAGSVLNVAVVERAASSSVRSGENAGKMLHHVNVVRAFVASPVAAPTGSVLVQVPASLPRDRADVIAYVQRTAVDAGGMPVLGAARAPTARP
jgi:hypothetical protein